MMWETEMKILTMLVMASMLFACGGPDEKAEAEPTVGKEIADDYNRQLEKARAVEDQAMQQKRKIDEALEAADNN